MTKGTIMAIEIAHIRLSDGIQDHEHITDCKWKSLSDGKVATSSKATLVDWIDNENGTAYVGSGSQRVNVGTVHPQVGKPYLRTYADGNWTNNLLALPRF
jgi:hypothetical protein